MIPGEILIGQEFYCFENSTTYVVFEINIFRQQHADGEIVEEEKYVRLRGTNNTVMSKNIKDLNENEWKLTKNAGAKIEPNVHIHGLKTPNRLDKVE